MSNLSDLRDALEGIGGKNGLGVDSFGAVAGIFGDVSGILDIFAILGLLSKNDDVQKTLSEIQNSLKAGFARLGESKRPNASSTASPDSTLLIPCRTVSWVSYRLIWRQILIGLLDPSGLRSASRLSISSTLMLNG